MLKLSVINWFYNKFSSSESSPASDKSSSSTKTDSVKIKYKFLSELMRIKINVTMLLLPSEF